MARARPRLIRGTAEPLIVLLRNSHEVIDRELARAPGHAARKAVMMIARRERLEAGDSLTVSRATVTTEETPEEDSR